MRFVAALVAVALVAVWLWSGDPSSPEAAGPPSAQLDAGLSAPSATLGPPTGAELSAPEGGTLAPVEHRTPERVPTAPPESGTRRKLMLHFEDEAGAPVAGARVTLVANTFDAADPGARRLATDLAVDGTLEFELDDDVKFVAVHGRAPGRSLLAWAVVTPAGEPTEATATWPAGGVLRLRAVDSAGAPARDVRVRMKPLGGDPGELHYALGTAPGERWFWTGSHGARRVTLSADGVGSATLGVVLGLGDDLDRGDVVLEPGPTFTGRVGLADGTPVAGVSVVAVDPGTRSTHSNHGRATTDADGRFVLATDRPGEVEVRVGREDPFGTAFVVPAEGEFDLELVSAAALVVLRAEGDAPFERWLAMTGESEESHDDWVGRWVPGQVGGAPGDDGLVRVLLEPSFACNFSASGAEVDGAPIEYFAVLDPPGSSRRVDLTLARRTEVADASIAITTQIEDGLDGIHVTAAIRSEAQALGRSEPTEGGARVVFDRLRAGAYVASAHAWPARPTDDLDVVVVPRERTIELSASTAADVQFAVVRGAYLAVDLTELPFAELDAAMELERWAFVELESVGDTALHPADAGPYLKPLGPDGEFVDGGTGMAVFGHVFRSPTGLPPGRVRILVHARGYESWSQTVELRAGAVTTVVPTPTPLAEDDG